LVGVLAADVKVTLSGDKEVPAVIPRAAGSETITVGADRAISGSVKTSGVAGTTAHIHVAAAGQNGPVIVPLVSDGNGWAVGPGAKLTDAQYDAFKAGHFLRQRPQRGPQGRRDPRPDQAVARRVWPRPTAAGPGANAKLL
jgi:hypothetical protein